MKIWLPAIQVGSGVDVFTQRLARALKKEGHEAIIEWFPPHYELAPWRLRKIPPPANTDIIHTGSWHGHVHHHPGIPLVVTEHHFVGHPEFRRCTSLAQKIYHRLHILRQVKKSYQAADAITAVSQTTANAMRSSGLCEKEVKVIYNWVDTDSFSPKALSDHDPATPWKIIFIGNPSYWKGADLIPAIANELGNSYSIYCLGGLRNRYRDKHHPGNVFTMDSVPPEAMPQLYASFDTVIVPARYEAFGYVALEAMACGIPVAGFASTGINEVCVNHKTALLSKTGDIKALCDNIREIRRNDALRLSMTHEGRRRAQSEFNERKCISAYLEIYKILQR
jgi:glycosyltransferase involved in cell wall biosynthesis